MKKLISIFGTGLLLSISLNAAEVDSFTGRYDKLEDSLPKINIRTNKMLLKGIKKANAWGAKKDKPCNEERLYKELRKFYGNHYVSELSKWIVSGKGLDVRFTSVKDSIYRDLKWYHAIVPGGFARVFKDPSAALMNVNGKLIGTDKFEHFLGSGFRYYNKNYIKGKGISAAMRIGFKAENGYMGAATTGVKAYADLVANFNGMRFWNHMLQKYDDVLGDEYNVGPYVSCIDNKWEKVKEVDWANYIDEAFDEGINCSKFKNKVTTDLIVSRIAELERNDGKRYTCPVLPSKLNIMYEKYGIFSSALLNMEGHKAAKEDNKAINAQK